MIERWRQDVSLRFLWREGEMRQRIREFDWRSTDLGDMAQWPQTLKTALSIMLDSATASYIAWGPRYYQFYNDAYIPVFGPAKHQKAIGETTPQTWHEIWDFVGPLFAKVRETGRAIWMENQFFSMLRKGYLEECYFSFSYSPLTDEQGEISGIFATVWETTQAYVDQRRKNALRLLTQHLAKAEEAGQVHAALEKTLVECPADLPFGLWYERKDSHSPFELRMAVGLQRGSLLAPEFLDPRNPGFYVGLRAGNGSQPLECEVGEAELRSSRYAPLGEGQRRSLPLRLLGMPLKYGNYQQPDAFVVLGVNAMRPYDEEHKEFLKSVGLHLENTMQRISRSLAERKEQDYQFHTVMAVLPCLVWLSDPEGQCIFVNQAWLDFTGRPLQDEVGEGWLAQVHPDDLDQVKQHCADCVHTAGEAFEFRLKSGDGSYRWVLSRAVPRYDIKGTHLGSIGTALDITERKAYEQMIVMSQKELHGLYDLLQRVREEERKALAREVHDQLGQVLSAAKIDIKLLEASIAGKTRLDRKGIQQELQSAQQAIEKSIEIARRLAHELRPPELASQGLTAAMRWHLQDFERRTKIRCEFNVAPDLCAIDKGVELALFGIFQEALTNILRHARAGRVWVSLECEGYHLRFQVRDDGIGTDMIEMEQLRTLGLKGMRERAASIGASLDVKPNPCGGTAILVTVPLAPGGEDLRQTRAERKT